MPPDAEKHGRPLKVCFPFSGDSLGGSHMSTLLLAVSLDRRICEPLILVHREGPLTDHLLQRDIPFRRVPEQWILEYRARTALRDVVRLLPATVTMQRMLDHERVDIVHANDNRMGTTWGPAARLAGCRFIWHQRTRPVLSRRMRFFTTFANYIVCVSDYCSTPFRGPGFLDRVSVVDDPFCRPAGLSDKVVAKALLQAKLSVPSDTCIVTFAANILPHKRPLIFVEAAHHIAARSTRPVAFVVLGNADGPLFARMQQRIAELGLTANFHFLGFCNPIEPWLRASDLLLAPSVEEGYGRTVVEAMLTETPVVAAASGGYCEVISSGTTGILVPPDDVIALAEAALSILENSAYGSSLARSALDFASRRLDVETHVEKMTTIYRKLGPVLRKPA
jgi:glycosyltransferase involved in cell wall biosynthesis